jgi:hypothetical protein
VLRAVCCSTEVGVPRAIQRCQGATHQLRFGLLIWRHLSGSNRRIRVLQTLPLATWVRCRCSHYRNCFSSEAGSLRQRGFIQAVIAPHLVPLAGFEPATLTFEASISSPLSYRGMFTVVSVVASPSSISSGLTTTFGTWRWQDQLPYMVGTRRLELRSRPSQGLVISVSLRPDVEPYGSQTRTGLSLPNPAFRMLTVHGWLPSIRTRNRQVQGLLLYLLR